MIRPQGRVAAAPLLSRVQVVRRPTTTKDLQNLLENIIKIHCLKRWMLFVTDPPNSGCYLMEIHLTVNVI